MSVGRLSDEAVRAATGKGWDEWRALLDGIGAAHLGHKEIAQRLHRDYGVPGWWSQGVTVEYERAIGRREVGQTCAGDFSAAASRTLPGSMDDALALWERWASARRDLDGVVIVGESRMSRSEKWRYWRADLEDGSRITLGISEKPGGKANLGLSHDKLPDQAAVERWKTYWRRALREL